LRAYAAFSGGDEGLKQHVKFANLNNSRKRSLLASLDRCVDLEDAFKGKSEIWKRALFNMNPMATANRKQYPNVAQFAERLRNQPKSLKTFNSKLQGAIDRNDFNQTMALCKMRPSLFAQKLNHLCGVFGTMVIPEFLKVNPSVKHLIAAYNRFANYEKTGGATILAGQDASNVTTYKTANNVTASQAATITEMLLNHLKVTLKESNEKVFIDPKLYYRPLATNNRAANFSLDVKAIGTTESLPEDAKVVRAYVHWHGKSDIDLSAHALVNGRWKKIGWDSSYNSVGITYSGDNTGHSNKNAEYFDVELDVAHANGVEWVLCNAFVYRGNAFGNWRSKGGVQVGYMIRQHPESNEHWLPETVKQALDMTTNARNTWAYAIHIPTRSFVYLDVNLSQASNVSTGNDAQAVLDYIETIFSPKADKISWVKLNQGHLLNLMYPNTVDSVEEADLVFDENVGLDQIAVIM
jgi:hypothetical protein